MTANYAEGITDEFMKPIITNVDGRIRDKDTMVFFDFRSDRMREITETFGIKQHVELDIKHPEGLVRIN